MKTLDIVTFALVIIGGLNWGLVGLFSFDLFAAIFGPMTIVSRLVYILVAAAAVYEGLMMKSILQRWGEMKREPTPAT